ncbi:DNA cytosine methyltransferase [Pseudomonas alliivorans]|nr:DNA cytosine methyltransferase [Pseudomonas alliivorans]MEE4724326.1 DNA cytosine methyltransferase [Pseudomonas alliivorans]MEE4760383.1 DNA cytosine methyltransferase [Pseudomonas alliivorans]MEE4765363.1 DNA cytosine methyltransferase [Pseudomonas alliivorans]MEE4775571.1 DNA cytosine methyltransferase [Pseudomonas alliivorans]
MKLNKSLKVVDLFCGMGGLTIGALQAAQELNLEFEITFACDIDKTTSIFFAENFKRYLKKYYQGDISEIISDDFLNQTTTFEKKISKTLKGTDFLFAGPPCQGHSNLNNHSRREDPRNALYLNTIKFIQLCTPKYFIIENVPSIIHSKESVTERAKKLLLGYGYEVQELIIEFKRLGVPQSRKRHVMLGSLNGDLQSTIAGIYTDEKFNLGDVLADLVGIESKEIFDSPSKMSATNLERAEFLYSTDVYDLPNELRPPCHRGQHSYKSMYGRLKWEDVAQTITGGFGSMGQGRFLHPLEKRVITPHEAARIQGLPDWLDYTGVTKRSELQKMIGNAVPPALSKRFVLSTQGR